MIEVERTNAPANGAAEPKAPDPEVSAKATRRRFTPEYKVRILREVEGCSRPGEIGALLRREGLYSSLLSDWRRQRDDGALAGLSPLKRGPKPSPEARRVAELEREIAGLRHRLKQAEIIIEVQKKLRGSWRRCRRTGDPNEGRRGVEPERADDAGVRGAVRTTQQRVSGASRTTAEGGAEATRQAAASAGRGRAGGGALDPEQRTIR